MKRLKFYPFLLLVSLLLTSCGDRSNAVSSPDGKLSLSVAQDDSGDFRYSFISSGDTLITNSLMGYTTKDGVQFPSQGWNIVDVAQKSVNTVWKPVWGKRKVVDDIYNELVLTLSSENIDGKIKKMDIALRAYDDGVAFRYTINDDGANKEVEIKNELTEFDFADNYTAWFYNGEYDNIGPEKLTDTDKKRRPVMTVKASDNQFMAIHEAYLQDGEEMVLKSNKGEKLFSVASSPKVLKGGSESAWRVIFFGEKAGEMVDSHLIELLNPDPDPNIDFSWVKPSVAVWDWRINGAKVDGFTYEMSYDSWIRMVDFAAKHNMHYLVLDANWYGPEFDKSSDPLIGDKAKDVQKLIKYGKEKGVGIWLYLNDVGGRQYPIEQTLKQYGDWGAAGVKYGFMRGGAVERLHRTKMITRLCAENKLLVDYHDGPIHPYGQMRTWPNALSREYCHAQLDAHRVFQPKTFVTTVFVNMIAGPIDMNNGMFDLRQGHTDRVDESQPVPSTLVSEAARTAIVFSGATILPDIPEYYEKYPSLLRFITAQKMGWVESRTLSGVIGEYIVMLRETDDHYIIGAAYNEQGGEVTIPLDFLPEGEFSAELTTDGKDAHYLNNRESYDVKTMKLSASTPLKVKIAAGGGACLLIEK